MTSHPRCTNGEKESPPSMESETTSPFTFLAGVQKDRVEAIHKLMLCELPPEWKNSAIEAVFEKKDTFLDKFYSWKWKVTQVSGSPEDETIFKLGKEMLKTWLTQRECHTEKRKVDADETENVTKKMRTENEEPRDVQVETISAIENKDGYKNVQTLMPSSGSVPENRLRESPLMDKGSSCEQRKNNLSSTIRKASPTLYPKNEKPASQRDNLKNSSVCEHSSRPPTSKSEAPKINERKRSRSRQRFPNRQLAVKATNILLLGETGVGKTTFINSFANYLRYGTLEKALSGDPVVLVDSAFTVTDKKNNMITIEAIANTGADHKLMKGNERFGGKGTSSTQDPVDHIFKWSQDGEEKCVRIIDTPGINDTRGTEQDARNFERILEHISELGELHAICILMKPNEARFTVGFRYCIDELLVKLHKNATKNILFCFTNTRSSMYRPGDSLATLQEYLMNLEKDTGVLITADRTNIFCYDNDCFRYLCMLRQLPNLEKKSEMNLFSDGWTHNIRESQKMLTKILGMSAHSVEDTVAINNTRKLVTALSRPLAEIAKNHVVNMKVIQERVEEIEKLKITGKALNDKIYQEQTVLETFKLPHPRTVCTSPQCVTYLKINKYQSQAVPKNICHDECYLTNVPEQCLNNPELAHCKAFNKGLCQICGCPWQKHMHISYDIRHVKENVMDQNIKLRLEHSWDRKKEAENLLEEEKNRLQQMEREHNIIRDSCAEFAAFLATNSIKQTSDPYEDYLTYLVDDEINKLDNGGGSEFMSIALCDMLHYYKKKLASITEEIKAGKRNALTTSELKKQIDNLSRLKICGPIIAKLKDVHLQEVTASQDDLEEVAHTKSSSSNATPNKSRDTNIARRHLYRSTSQDMSDLLKDLRVDSADSNNSQKYGSSKKYASYYL